MFHLSFFTKNISMNVCYLPINCLQKAMKYLHRKISIYFSDKKSILMFGPHQKDITYRILGQTTLKRNYVESGVSVFETFLFKTNFIIYQTENVKTTNKLTQLICIFSYKTDIIIYTIDIRNTKEEMKKHKTELHDIVKTNFYLKTSLLVIGIDSTKDDFKNMNISRNYENLKENLVKSENIIHLLELMRFKRRAVACFIYEKENINLIRNWICKHIKSKGKEL